MPAANGSACKSICPAYAVWVRAWQAQVGRLKLYLLDLNDPENPPIVRGITNELYGGGLEMRITQETRAGHRRLAAVAHAGIESGSVPPE